MSEISPLLISGRACNATRARHARFAAKGADGRCWLTWRPGCSRLRALHLSNSDDLIQRFASESKYVFGNLLSRVRLCLPDTPVERLRLVPKNIARLPSGAGELHSEGICFVERRRRHRQTNDDAGPLIECLRRKDH